MGATLHAPVDPLDYLVRTLGADLSARDPVYTTEYSHPSLSGAIYATPATALHAAALGQNEAVARRLIELGAHVNAVDKNGASPVTYAADNPTGTPAVIRLLFEHGSKTEIENNCQASPLHRAAYRGNIEAIKLLLAYGADVAARSSYNFLPLHHAAERGHYEAVVLLVEGGSDVNARTVIGWRPFDIAGNRFDRISEYLKANGAVTRFVA